MNKLGIEEVKPFKHPSDLTDYVRQWTLDCVPLTNDKGKLGYSESPMVSGISIKNQQ